MKESNNLSSTDSKTKAFVTAGKYMLSIFLLWILCFLGIPGQILSSLPGFFLAKKRWFTIVILNYIILSFIPPLIAYVLPNDFMNIGFINTVSTVLLIISSTTASWISPLSAFVYYVIFNKRKTPVDSSIKSEETINNKEETSKEPDRIPSDSNDLLNLLHTEPEINHLTSKESYVESTGHKSSLRISRTERRLKKMRKFKIVIACLSICLGVSIAGNIYLYYGYEKKCSELQEANIIIEYREKKIDSLNSTISTLNRNISDLRSTIEYAIDYVSGDLEGWQAGLDFYDYMNRFIGKK